MGQEDWFGWESVTAAKRVPTKLLLPLLLTVFLTTAAVAFWNLMQTLEVTKVFSYVLRARPLPLVVRMEHVVCGLRMHFPSHSCLLYTSPEPTRPSKSSRMPSSA